jgi:hypothetical protein
VGTYKRTWQLLHVLAGNVLATWPHRAQFTWFVVDFNDDPSGEPGYHALHSHPVRSSVEGQPHQTVYVPCGGGWHASKCKNTTHMLPITTGQTPLDQLVHNDTLITTPFLDAMCDKAPALAQGNVGSLRLEGADGGVTGRVALGAVTFQAGWRVRPGNAANGVPRHRHLVSRSQGCPAGKPDGDRERHGAVHPELAPAHLHGGPDPPGHAGGEGGQCGENRRRRPCVVDRDEPAQHAVGQKTRSASRGAQL